MAGKSAISVYWVQGFDEYNFRDPTEFSKFDFQDVSKFTDEGVIEDYMSPYMQNVVDRQKDAAVKDFQRMQQEARCTGDTTVWRLRKQPENSCKTCWLKKICKTSLAIYRHKANSKAFEQAASMFGQDRSAMMEQESKRYNELAAREKAQAEEYARAGDQAAAERARIQAAQYEDYARVQANQAQEDRAAAQFGIDAAGAASEQAAQLAKLQQMARAGDLEAIQALGAVGKQLDLREQAALDLAYEDFLRQQGYGKEQLNFLSGILRGMPAQMGLTEQRLLQQNPLQQALGAGIGGVSLIKALGGLIRIY